MSDNIRTIILCGGRGARMGCEDLPKPMFAVGRKPILWHIMRIYSHYGFSDFILSMGFRKNKIEGYFKKTKEWNIEFVDTGLTANTGDRIRKLKNYILGDTFFATYGDGLSSVNVNRLLRFHKQHKKIATLVSVRPTSPFGIISIDSHTGSVTHFHEKPVLDHWINGGFFVFNRDIFKYMKSNESLEKDILPRLAETGNLQAYKHEGFWECMDTYKDNQRLNQLWNSGERPWAVWEKERI